MTAPRRHPLRQAPFFWFWLAQTVSILGDRVYSVALPFLFLELGGDALGLGRLLALYTAPQVAFLLLGGVLVDRWPKRTTMIVSDLAHALLLALAVLLLAAGELRLEHLYGLSALFGLASAVFLPATASIVPQLVAREDLTRANAARALAGELAGIAGPPLGGLLVALGGLSLALALDALSFVLAALCLLALRPRPASTGARRAGYFAELAEGFRIVAASSWLWATILIFSLVNVFTSGVSVVLLPLLAKARFAGAPSLGLLFAGLAAGALVASLVLGRLGRVPRRGALAYAGVALAGLGLMGVALAPGIVLAVGCMILVGFSLALFGVLWEALVQERVPPNVLGRVLSIDMLGSFALLPLGFLLTGGLAGRLEPGPLALGYGGAVLLLAMVGLALPAVRRLE